MNQFISRIKTATASLHAQLEETAISKAIMSPSITKAEYASYLSRILIMHKAVEEKTLPIVQPIVRDYTERYKTRSIEEDLNQLAYSEIWNEPFFDKNYSTDINFNLGLMYVTEGSVLGGQVILKNIRKQLGEDTACRFLNVYGQTTGSLWKSFLMQMDQHEQTLPENEKEQIIAGAIYGFERAYVILK